MPAATASSTTYWIAGLSTTGSISFGCALVAGRNRVPRPAAGITALVTLFVDPRRTLVRRPMRKPSRPAPAAVRAPVASLPHDGPDDRR